MIPSIETIKQNWRSGLTVALISLPLSVSLAVASQASPLAGILTAIWAGVIASFFGGSNFNIIGPTGALSGILATYALAHGAGSLSMLAVLTGVIILVAYFLKLEKYIVLIPGSTIYGFTLGVAFIIALNQLNFALGLTNLPVHTHFIDNVIESLKHISQASLGAVGVFVIFLVLLFLFKKYVPKIPGAIFLAPVGILLGYLSVNKYIPLEVQTLGLKFPNIEPRLFIIPEFGFNWCMWLFKWWSKNIL